jgi:hypothetical protein
METDINKLKQLLDAWQNGTFTLECKEFGPPNGATGRPDYIIYQDSPYRGASGVATDLAGIGQDIKDLKIKVIANLQTAIAAYVPPPPPTVTWDDITKGSIVTVKPGTVNAIEGTPDTDISLDGELTIVFLEKYQMMRPGSKTSEAGNIYVATQAASDGQSDEYLPVIYRIKLSNILAVIKK